MGTLRTRVLRSSSSVLPHATTGQRTRRLGFKETSVRPDGTSRNVSATRRKVGRPPRVAVRSRFSCTRKSRRRSDVVDDDYFCSSYRIFVRRKERDETARRTAVARSSRTRELRQMSDSTGLLDSKYSVRVQHTGLGQQTLGTGSRGTVVSSGNGLQRSRSPAQGTRDGRGAGGQEPRVHQNRPRRGVGEKKWIREWRSRIEQRLTVGG